MSSGGIDEKPQEETINGLYDIMNGRRTEIKIGEYGIVGMIDTMPRLVKQGQTLDHAVLQAARTSYGQHSTEKSDAENRGLIRYLFRKNHVTPFEMVNVKWFHRLPIFVARQLIRHRTASVNEFSMRYKEPKDEFFVPSIEGVRKQSKNNKQGSEGPVDPDDASHFIHDCNSIATDAFQRYECAVKGGIGKEMARVMLPLSIFTEWFWELDLNNIMRFLALRMDKHAQKEIRDYADAMYELLSPLAPWSFEAFNDFSEYRGGLKLSRLEVEVLVDIIARYRSLNHAVPLEISSELSAAATKGEQQEWFEKRSLLGLVAHTTTVKE